MSCRWRIRTATGANCEQGRGNRQVSIENKRTRIKVNVRESELNRYRQYASCTQVVGRRTHEDEVDEQSENGSLCEVCSSRDQEAHDDEHGKGLQ